jgi:hypothetical protein
MGLLRMRAAISLPAQTEQRRCFWWGHDTVGNKPLNYIVIIMKQMGLLRMRAAISLPAQQCCGSGSETGSTGSTCFWTSWIRIRILLSLSKNSKKNLDFY